MLFKNRGEAGERLAQVLKNKVRNKKNWIVVSLLRGGVLVGEPIAKEFTLPHLFLPVVKIASPNNPEYALGAITFSQRLYNQEAIKELSQKLITEATKLAEEKFINYCQKYHCEENKFEQLKNKKVILVDDGAATGLSLYTAAAFLRRKKVKKILLALPVAPADFNKKVFDEAVILHEDPFLTAVSNYYQDFSPVEPPIQ